MDAMTLLVDFPRQTIGAGLVTLGFVFIFGAIVGLLRFPDFYTRVHAAMIAHGLGAVLVVAGLALAATDAGAALRLALLALLIAAINPTLAHIVTGAAHAGGLAPLVGPYVAPRPGGGRGP
jgi:multicomponent Na+:H+ antiporter subunit G